MHNLNNENNTTKPKVLLNLAAKRRLDYNRELVAKCKLEPIPNGASCQMQASFYDPISLSNSQIENDQRTSSQLSEVRSEG